MMPHWRDALGVALLPISVITLAVTTARKLWWVNRNYEQWFEEETVRVRALMDDAWGFPIDNDVV